jgi:CDP-diacylglycerol pyrophosphatase
MSRMTLSATRSLPLRGRLRFSEYGWGRRALLIAAALVGSAAVGYAGNLASRNALWQVVRACALDKATTGSPLPCLAVEGAGDDGFVVLRPPFGEPDTILAPTRRIVGIEDPFLQTPEAPNYFALAWDARRWLPRPPPPGRAALAVNSRIARSQDQLHIHIGCLSAEFAGRLGDRALGPAAGVWFRGPNMARGLELWTYRTGTKDWSDLAPFQLLKPLVGDVGMRRTTLAGALIGGELVLAALRSHPGGWYASAEDVIDPEC